MKIRLVLYALLVGLLGLWAYDHWVQFQRSKCLFFNGDVCVLCSDAFSFPVGYREDCACPNRVAYYVDGGLFPAWQCMIDKHWEEVPDLPSVSLHRARCPEHHPLRDLLGNCYACDSALPVRLAHRQMATICGKRRYLVPDGLAEKSLLCPNLDKIQDAEVCVACGGIVFDGKCVSEGFNHFCSQNSDCAADEWCYPLRRIENHQGVCTKKTAFSWFCSGTDGYDLKATELVCARQGMRLPTLDEIEKANENLQERCPTLDMWTFFTPDGAVWLESFMQEFLFTREGESQRLGGHTFHALCHKD